MKSLRAVVDTESDTRFKTKLALILENAPHELKLAVKAASDKGASSWVTACPSYDHGTVLHKGEFTDACYIRYGWTLLNLSTMCGCGKAMSLQHALDCPPAVYVLFNTMRCGTRWHSVCEKLGILR